MVTILMMSAKMAMLGLPNIDLLWEKVNDVIISVHDVTKKFLSRDSNYAVMCSCDQSLVTLGFLWEKLS